MASGLPQVSSCDLPGPPWAPDVSCYSELPPFPILQTLTQKEDPPPGTLQSSSPDFPPAPALAPTHLHIPHLWVQLSDPGHPRLQERLREEEKGDPPGTLGALLLPRPEGGLAASPRA